MVVDRESLEDSNKSSLLVFRARLMKLEMRRPLLAFEPAFDGARSLRFEHSVDPSPGIAGAGMKRRPHPEVFHNKSLFFCQEETPVYVM